VKWWNTKGNNERVHVTGEPFFSLDEGRWLARLNHVTSKRTFTYPCADLVPLTEDP
jgi:hypothetical protein